MRKLLSIILLLITSLSAFSQNQEQEDSLVVLMSSKSAQLVDIKGASYRKVIGPARFLHNNTYLICDTALWNVDSRFIEAWGNVSILQDETVLTSDKLMYLVDEDLAQFRGSLVQLQDKDHNVLRTRHLDYNTKDSVAVFRFGGSMRDKDGQIIESDEGTYESKIKIFTFNKNVNMFTDSIFVKTSRLIYESELDKATFGRDTYAWQEENMLTSDAGWYDRRRELFLFNRDVYVMSQDQEGWCDTLRFHRNTNEVEMMGNTQVNDTTRNVFALAGKIHYLDSISKVTLTREPAVITQTEEQDGSLDTVYLGAEKLVYYTLRKCDIAPAVLADAEKRLESIDVDPVGEFRKKAAEAARKAAEEEAMKDPNYRAKKEAEEAAKAKAAARNDSKPAPAASNDRPSAPSLKDSLAVGDLKMPVDSLSAPDSLSTPDSLASAPAGPLDTTKIGFLEALRNVRIYKKNMQVVCDSLMYTDLDSLARLYIEPVVWQDSVRQYAADSITVVISDGTMKKASLMSEAFITIQEDSTHYNQIKGAEMIAYFDGKGGLTRFDGLGGASAIFFIEENGVLATVNKTDSKMMSAVFENGDLQRIYYYDQPKNDGYPVVQLEEEERTMKGFNWQPGRRPADRSAVTELSLRPGERSKYSRVPQPRYKQTDIYFPGYIGDIRRQIEVRDSLKIVRQREQALEERRAEERARLDSIAKVDSLARIDSLAALKPALDSLDAALAAKDSLKVSADSLDASDSLKAMTPAELKAAKKAEKEAAKLKKQQEKEARWAELDKRDEEKAKAKEEKKKEKARRKKRKALRGMAEQVERDALTLQRYKEKYEKQKAKEAEKAARKAEKLARKAALKAARAEGKQQR